MRGPTFRDQIADDYKAHRDPMPDALRQQVADVEQLCAATPACR